MYHILSYLFIALSLGYTLLVVLYLYHWSQLLKIKLNNPGDQEWPTVSVIVPFRNEAHHLPKLVSDLQNQNYPGRYEVILINDHSEDDAQSHLHDLPENFQVLNPAVGSHGKKSALEAGINHSLSEYLLFSDADTERGLDWIEAMITCAIQHNADMTTGPVLAAPTQNQWLSQYYSSELAAFMIVSGGAIRGRLHAMANGANMLVKRSQLPLDDPFGKSQSESGDDLFLAEMFFKNQTLVFCKSEKALVTTYPPATEHDLIQQKLRWASKNKLLTSGVIRPAMMITAALPLAIISSPILALFYGTSLIWLGVGMFLIKTAADHVLINQGLAWKNQSTTWEMSIRQQLTNLMITSRTIVALVLGQNAHWKGRKI